MLQKCKNVEKVKKRQRENDLTNSVNDGFCFGRLWRQNPYRQNKQQRLSVLA